MSRRARLRAHGASGRRSADIDRDLAVPGHLVPYVRSGAKAEMRDAIEVMQAELDTTIDPGAWRSTQVEFDEARALLDVVGVEDDLDQGDIVLDLGRSPRLILRVLEGEYDSEVRRLRDAQEEGHDLPPGDIPGLGRLVHEVRVRTGVRKRRRSNRSFLEVKLEQRRIRRRRDNAD